MMEVPRMAIEDCGHMCGVGWASLGRSGDGICCCCLLDEWEWTGMSRVNTATLCPRCRRREEVECQPK